MSHIQGNMPGAANNIKTIEIVMGSKLKAQKLAKAKP
jgi:hypothetical protein